VQRLRERGIAAAFAFAALAESGRPNAQEIDRTGCRVAARRRRVRLRVGLHARDVVYGVEQHFGIEQLGRKREILAIVGIVLVWDGGWLVSLRRAIGTSFFKLYLLSVILAKASSRAGLVAGW
jgi:hypothetical protein